MRKIRIGNDVKVIAHLTTDSDSEMLAIAKFRFFAVKSEPKKPEIPDGVVMMNADWHHPRKHWHGEVVELAIAAEGVGTPAAGTVTAVWKAEQQRLGVWDIVVTAETPSGSKAAGDVVEAIMIVKHTEEEAEIGGGAAGAGEIIAEKVLDLGEITLTVGGLSAYELAVAKGFEGTVEEWLQSLQGEKGEKGDKGDKGERGPQGIPGMAGQTPMFAVEINGKKHSIYVNGSLLVEIMDGEDGHTPVITGRKEGKKTLLYADDKLIAEIMDGEDGQGAAWEDTEYVIEEGQAVAPTLAQGKYRFVAINAKDDSAYFRVQGHLYGWSREGIWSNDNPEFTPLADTSGEWGCSFHVDTLDGCDGVRIQRYVSVIDEKVDDAVSGKWHTVELLDGVGTYSLHEEGVVRFRLLGEGSAYIHYGGGDIVLENSHPEYELYADLSGGFNYETDTSFSVDVCEGGVSQRAEQALYVASNKVDKVSGKGLSTNDYTNADKQKLSKLGSAVEDIADDVTDLNVNVSQIGNQVTLLNTMVGKKYEKPSDGIPSTDLASAVQTSISRADAIYDDYINAQNLM